MAERTASEVQACRVCGCTWTSACEGGCYWVEPDLCSACVEPDAQADQGTEEVVP